MTNDTRTADDIERDIEAERAQMSDTINNLQKKFSVETIVSDIGAMFRGPGGDLGRTISDTLGRNPAAVAMVGVGLAWLLLGKDRASAPSPRRQDRDTAYGGNYGRTSKAVHREAEDSWFDDGGMIYGSEPRQQTNTFEAEGGAGLMGSLREGADAVAGAVSGAVSGAAGAVRDTAMNLTDRLSSGTESMTEDARARVLAARRAAHDARDAAKGAVVQGKQMASNLFTDQPLVVGALAVAVGAALGGLLPSSQIEDDTLGANSDRLFADAQRIYREERDKAMAVVKAVANEATGALQDTGSDLADLLPEGKTAGNVIVDHLSDAATRVTNTAREEATRQGLMGDRQS